MQTRGKRARALLAVPLALVALGATACGGDDEGSASSAADKPAAASTSEAKKEVRIALLSVLNANSYSQAGIEAVKELADKEGASVRVFDANLKADRQIAQIQNVMTSGQYDAILINPVGASQVGPAIKQAIKDGIKVGSWGTPLGGDPAGNDVGDPEQVISANTPFRDRGKYIGELTVEGCKGIDPCEVAYMLGLTAFPFEGAAYDAFEEAIAGNDNIKVVAKTEGGYAIDPARTATENLLQAHPDLKVVATVSDQESVGVILAAKKAGKDVKVASVGASDLAAKGVKDGSWLGSMVVLPATEASIVARALIDAVRGSGKKGMVVDPIEQSPIGPVLTPANVEGFAPQWPGN